MNRTQARPDAAYPLGSQGGWQLALGADRTNTLHRPDGTLHHTATPPTAQPPTASTPKPAAKTEHGGSVTVDLAAVFDEALQAVLARTAERSPP